MKKWPAAAGHFLLDDSFEPVSQSSLWMNMPERSFGSNQVDFGGISRPASATEMRSSMEVGYMEKAMFMSV